MNPGIIVLDGHDVAGKTTLARALIEKYGGHYLHATYRFKDRMHLYHLALLRRAIKKVESGQMVIMDRWWPSEIVYGDVYREGKRVPNEAQRVLHRLALRYGVTYVICYRDSSAKLMEEYAKSHARGKELYDVDPRMIQVYDRFAQLYESITGQRSRWHRFNVDTAIRNPHYFTFQVDAIAHCSSFFNSSRVKADIELPHSVGSPFSDYIFVGERINPRHRALTYPWIAFHGASVDIGKSLGELGIPEHRICWTNAYLPDGNPNEHLAALLKRTSFRRIVAMGNEATEFCKSSGRCDFSMQHPAYITRFKGLDTLTRNLGVVFNGIV